MLRTLKLADSALGPRVRFGAASILANRQLDGSVVVGDLFIQKGSPEDVAGVVTEVNHTDGYLRINGLGVDPGIMIRFNDPEGRHSIRQGLGCAGGPNCGADTRFGLDPDNYTATITTTYPACIPSTENRTGPFGSSTGSDAAGAGDALCPDSNRGASPVPHSTGFADNPRLTV